MVGQHRRPSARRAFVCRRDMFVIIVGASALLPPTRLRASHTDFSTTPSFALAHDSRPLFQWAPRGSSQAAFTLEVDDAATGLSIWRSNKISSSTPSFQYPDSAPALPPAATYTWRLRTHDDNGAVSPFAAAAFHIAPSPDTWSNVSWLGDAKLNVCFKECESVLFLLVFLPAPLQGIRPACWRGGTASSSSGRR